MGLLASASASVNVPKPDFVQLVAQLPAGTVAGCKWCKKTIFWNGSFWNHVDGDRHKCERGYSGGPHDVVKVGAQSIEVDKTWFRGRPIMLEVPVHRCTACGEEKPAKLFDGYLFHDLAYDCPAKVATPQEPGPTQDNTDRRPPA